MGVYIKPNYFQTIHYYFFCLGIFSLTSSFLFSTNIIYSYFFVSFYISYSALSWYISWYMYTKSKDIFVINTWRYVASHVLLTLWSGGLAVLMWYMFETQFEVVMTSMLLINFFVVFFAMIWSMITRFRFIEKIFEWRELNKMKMARGIVMSFRDREKLKLVDDDLLNDYKWGTMDRIDHLLLKVRKLHGKNDADFANTVREIESGICQLRIQELERKIEWIGKKREMSETDKKLVNTYKDMIEDYKRRMFEYEKYFYTKFKK